MLHCTINEEYLRMWWENYGPLVCEAEHAVTAYKSLCGGQFLHCWCLQFIIKQKTNLRTAAHH